MGVNNIISSEEENVAKERSKDEKERVMEAREKQGKSSKTKKSPIITQVTKQLEAQVLELLEIGLSDKIIRKEAHINGEMLKDIKKTLEKERGNNRCSNSKGKRKERERSKRYHI